MPNGGLVLPPNVTTTAHRDVIVALAARHHLPAVYNIRPFVTAGGLMSYGVDFTDVFRQAASVRGSRVKNDPFQPWARRGRVLFCDISPILAIISMCIHDRAQHDPAFVRPIIAGSAVHRGQLVPHQHIADAPVMVINEKILRRVLGQFLDQRPGFLSRHAGETMRVHRVDEQGPPTGHRVLDHRGPLHFVIYLFGFSFVIAIKFLTGGSGAAAVQAHQRGEPVLRDALVYLRDKFLRWRLS